MSDAPVLQAREQIELLERDIERLRVMYQQYFMGTLKTEPLTLRKHIYRQILQAKPGTGGRGDRRAPRPPKSGPRASQECPETAEPSSL